MTGKTPFSEDDLYRWATDASIERGWDYYESGAVASLVRQGDELQAKVWGSDVEPYRVRVYFDARGMPVDAECTCPYDWGGWCKHIVATLLAYLNEPETVRERPPLEEQVADLSAEDLRALVAYLAEKLPAVPDLVDAWLALRAETSPEEKPTPERTRPKVQPEVYERQARTIIHSLDHMRPSEAYWHVSEVIDDLEALASKAKDFAAVGDVDNALSVLVGVTNAYVTDGFILDDSDGYVGEFAYTLDQLWASVLLAIDLDEETRAELKRAMSSWQVELEDYGLDDAFEVALSALDLRTPEDVLDTEDPELIRAYLDRLEQRGEHEAYLEFARAAGEDGAYAVKLIELGRVDEALTYVQMAPLWGREWEEVIQALYEAGRTAEALDLAASVLEKDKEEVDDLSPQWLTWLADRAEAAGRRDLALRAVVRTFRRLPSLALYRQARALAGEEWPRLREDLLAFLRQRPAAGVDVFLEEGLWDDALRAVEDGLVSYDTMRRVVDAALPHRPERAARIARRQAEEIMDAGRSQAYHHAVDWLRRVKRAYQVMGKEDEWRSYLEGLIQKHFRKYKLRPMLEELRE